MPFDQALRLASIWLASTSFIGLTLGAGLPEWLAVLTGAALIVALIRSREGKLIERLATFRPVSTAGWNLLVIVGFLGFWVDVLWVSGELLPAGIHFLMILMIIKLFNLNLRRDYLHLYAISLVAILASGSLTTDLWYLPMFLLYLLAAVWTLLLFQQTKHPEEAGMFTSSAAMPPRPPASASQVTPQLFWLANGLALATFGLTLAIFFTIPRVSTGFYQKGFGENLRTSGFSETVNLGAIGPIKRDPSIVMRVELSDGSQYEAGRLYLRGVAFDQYDGKAWTNRLSYRRTVSEDGTGTFVLRGSRSPTPARLGEAIRQNILLEPLDTSVLFAAPHIERVSGKLPSIQSDLAGSVYFPFPSSSRIEYSVISRSNPVLPTDLNSESSLYPESFARHFLQIPARSERIAVLAKEVTHTYRTTYDKADAIQSFLTRNFRYSLDAPLKDQDQPLEEFLFTRKTGYCEHYATAMVMMLRTIGIPARLVTGFLASEWNEYGNYYLVRQQDAHAWVEMHLPNSGWITMDPTPPSIETVGSGSPTWHALERMMDIIQLQWSRFFVQYSAADQLAAVRELKAGGMSARNKALDSLSALFSPFMAMLSGTMEYASKGSIQSVAEVLGLALIGLAVFLWLGVKRPWVKGMASREMMDDKQLIVQLYRRMITHLGRKGISKLTAMPPLEFARLTQERWSDAGSAVASITELYCRTRFGRIPLTREELRRAEDHLRCLMALDKSG
jgi:transglutaminase-like putative cysteine protease